MRKLLLGLIVMAGVRAGAHGEDKPGPHGGFISMPGAFHVELVPAGATRLKAYLLDIDWKNPSVKDSSLAVAHGKNAAKCKAEDDHFVCDFPAGADLTKAGELQVNAVREKQKGNTVKYILPLTLGMKH